MALRHSQPVRFSPAGLSDTLDSTTAFPGAMGSLRNLIPDPRTRNLWQCRPAALPSTLFAGFTTPGFISCFLIVGTRAYGLLSTGRNAGKDEPFCYDILAGAFVTVSGITNANSPTSPAAVGAWTPPTMDVVGSKVIVTHPGFPGGGGNYFGWFDISNPAAPAWSAGNTSTNALPAVPVAVKNYRGRAWFLVNPSTGQPAAYYTDILNPTTITNANQALTFDDNTALTALGGLPLSNQLGGIIQALIVFKGTSNIYQVTGDAATSDLEKNSLNIATGTLAPNSVCTTPKGLAFVAPDGVRLINFQAQVSDPIGNSGDGVALPFIFAGVPSRIAAACNSNVFRVSVQNDDAIGSPTQEYWYDIARKQWSGPHDFPASLIQPYGNTFIMAPHSVTGKLFQSDIVQSTVSTFVENGTQMTFYWATSILPDTQQMAENSMVETTIKMALAASVDILFTAFDQNGSLLDSITLLTTQKGSQWGHFTWGVDLWQGAANILAPRQLAWHYPIVSQRLGIGVFGNCAAGIKIGDLFMRMEQLGYMMQ